jgi:hypothetical protein
MARKEIAKSIRMTNEVYKFVDGFKGEGFNEKFENLVLFCLREEKELQKRIKEQQKTYTANEKRLDLQRKTLTDLENIARSVSLLLDISKKAEVAAKGVQLKMHEDEAAENVTQKPTVERPLRKENELQKEDILKKESCCFCKNSSIKNFDFYCSFEKKKVKQNDSCKKIVVDEELYGEYLCEIDYIEEPA